MFSSGGSNRSCSSAVVHPSAPAGPPPSPRPPQSQHLPAAAASVSSSLVFQLSQLSNKRVFECLFACWEEPFVWEEPLVWLTCRPAFLLMLQLLQQLPSLLSRQGDVGSGTGPGSRPDENQESGAEERSHGS